MKIKLEKNDIINELEGFKSAINEWYTFKLSNEQKKNLRSKINRKRRIIEKILYRSGTAKSFDWHPPPMVGGFVRKGINPMDVIFDPPIGVPVNEILIDSIDEALGIIEREENFVIEDHVKSTQKSIKAKSKKNSKKIFIVHGHDNELKETVARFLEKIGLEPIILHEKVNGGLTIIEKFEINSDVNFALVLMTPDDIGNSKNKGGNLNLRARQNVIFELGYFMGKLGRKNVCALIKGEVERPSDYDGIVYIAVDDSEGWKLLLAKELKNAKLNFNANNVF